MTDDELIDNLKKAEFQAGRPLYEAANALFDRHKDLVKRALSEVLGEGTAEELACLFFFTALRRVHRYDPAQGTFPEWLATAVRRDAVNHLRGQKIPTGAGAWALPSGMDPRHASPARTQGDLAALAMLLAAASSRPATTARSEMKPITKGVYRALSPLILGGCLFAAVSILVLPRETDPEWITHPLLRVGCSAGLLVFALWLSARLSRLLEWVELDGMHLRWKRLWARRVRQESLGDLAKIHSDGTIEFSNGRRIHFDGHVPARGTEIVRSIAWWHKHGIRHANPKP